MTVEQDVKTSEQPAGNQNSAEAWPVRYAKIDPAKKRFIHSALIAGAVVALTIICLPQSPSLSRKEMTGEGTRLLKSQIELVDFRAADGDMSLIEGRIRNHSEKAISYLKIRTVIKDCQKNACDIVGDALVEQDISVPPHQARDFSAYAMFTNLGKPKGDRQYIYEIVDIKDESAKLAQPGL